jgi:hypothetical protein
MKLPGEQLPVIHRELRAIRRISGDRLRDGAQDFAMDRRLLLTKETHMNTIYSKLTAFAAALAMNGLVFGALGYLFTLQSHPNMSAIGFAKGVITQQWLS